MKRIAATGLVLLLCALLTLPGLALGGDVDIGGGGGGGGDDYNYSNNGSYRSSGSSGGGSRNTAFDWVIAIAFIGILVWIFSMIPNQTSQSSSNPSYAGPLRDTKQVNAASLDKLREQDRSFSAAEVEAKVKQWVTDFEIAWCAGDMTPQREFITDSLFQTYQNQLHIMRSNGEVSRSEDLAVLECEVEHWRMEGHLEVLFVWLREKKRTYQVSCQNRDHLLKGDPSVMYYLDYRWQLVRPAKKPGDDTGESPFGESNRGWRLNKVEKLAQVNRNG